jgi:hypothetical protein
MFPHSTANALVDSWILSAVGFHAQIFPTPATGPVSTKEHVPDSGFSSLASFDRFDRDLSSSKMSAPCSTLFEMTMEGLLPSQQSEPYSETYPISGSMRTGLLFQRKTAERRTVGTGASSLQWPTSQAHDATGPRGKNNVFSDHHYRPHDLAMSASAWPDRKDELGLDQQARNFAVPSAWPTPRAEDAEACGNHPNAVDSLKGAATGWLTPHGMSGIDHTGKLGAGGECAQQATNWVPPSARPTPKAISGGANSKRAARGSGGPDLQESVTNWGTPQVTTNSGIGGMRKDAKARLEDQATMWGTPTSRDHKDGTSREADCETNGLLGRQAIRSSLGVQDWVALALSINYGYSESSVELQNLDA